MKEKELLRKLGEETLYSAKGHFKSCDQRRQLITYTIWVCAVLNVVGLIGIHPIADKWFSAFGLFGTIALLIWNEGEGKNYRAKHKEAAEKYLALHKSAPIGTIIQVRNDDNDQKIFVRVIGKIAPPTTDKSILKLSPKAMERLGAKSEKITVSISYIP